MKVLNLSVLLVMLLPCFFTNAVSRDLVDEASRGITESDSVNPAPINITELKGTFKFDGIVDDPCWDSLAPLPLVMHIPTFGIQPTENSEVFICHDNVYVYIAGRFFDKEAGKINVASRMRDNIGPQEDGFLVIFDTFNDHENAVGFRTNVAGVRQDLTISNDG